jgi:hypothetical protein
MKTTIRYFAGLSFLVFALIVTPEALFHRVFSSRDKIPYTVKEFNVSTPAKLKVETSGGAIKVESQSGSKVKVEMYVQKHGKYYREGDIDLSNYRIEIDKDGSQINAIARHKGPSWGNNPSISFVVYVPTETSCDLNTSGGPISVSSVNGTQELHTSGGGIDVDHLKGKITLRTSGGPINISDVEGNIDGKTSGGPISAANGSGTFDLETSGGPINLRHLSGSVRAHTSGGSISADIVKLVDQLDLRTSGGNIVASLPSDQGFDLDAHGSLVDTNLNGFSGSFHRDHVEGKVKGGGPQVTLHTSGGVIRIR